MTHFEVGSKVDIFKGKEGTLFDINGAGAVYSWHMIPQQNRKSCSSNKENMKSDLPR